MAAAVLLEPAKFGVLTLVSLIHITALGVLRALVHLPSLVQQRTESAYRASASTFFTCALIICPLFMLAALPLGLHTDIRIWLLLLTGTVAAATHDWLRHRSIGDSRTTAVLASDAGRLALTICATVVMLSPGKELVSLALAWLSSLPSIALLMRAQHLPLASGKFQRIRSMALWQTVDFSFSQVQAVVPLLLIGILSSPSATSPWRLAATFLGPVTLLYSALSTHAVAGCVGRSDREVAAFIHSWAVRAASLVAAACVALLLPALFLAPRFRAASPDEFIIAFLCTSSVYVSSAYASTCLIGYRAMRRSRIGAFVRIGATFCASVGFLIGFAQGGASASLVAGYVTSVAFWIVFVCVVEYQRRKTRKQVHVAVADSA